MTSIIDNIAEVTIYKFEPPIKKIPLREKHFNTAIATFFGLVLANIPLFYGDVFIHTRNNLVTFRVDGTWMQLGTQPFVFGSMVANLLFDNQVNTRSRALGFVFSIIMANNHHWLCTVQLIGVSCLILQVLTYLETHGSVNLSTALICAHASKNIICLSPSIVSVVVLILFVSWLGELVITIPLTHMQRKSQTMSMQLPIMYNSTTALVMYYTLIEAISTFFPPILLLQSNRIQWSTIVAATALLIGLHFFNRYLPIMEERTGKHLIQKWKKQHYTIKGWRSPQQMAKYVQRIIDNNVQWNTIILFALWCLGVLLQPPVSVTTLFILTSTVKQLEQ